MKPILYPILAAIACGFASGQTAYTNPVGYVTVNVPANGDTTFTPPLERAPLLAAASTSISGNDVGVADLTSGSFASPNPACYLQITSGALAGQRFPISSNDSDSIIVSSSTNLETLGFVAGDSIKVVPYWTLNTLFPAGAGVGTSSDAFNPTSFVLASSTGYGTNKASSNAYFYCSGDVENEIGEGWYDASDPFTEPLNDLPLDPSRLYTIRSSNNVAQEVVVSGQVPALSPVIPVAVNEAFNDVLLGSPFPVDVTLQDSGLQSAIQGSPDAFNPVEVVFVYDDNASIYNKAASVGYFYCTGDVENEIPEGWYDSNDPFAGPVTDEVLKAGRCFVIRKAPYDSAGAIPWVATLPY